MNYDSSLDSIILHVPWEEMKWFTSSNHSANKQQGYLEWGQYNLETWPFNDDRLLSIEGNWNRGRALAILKG